LLIFISYYAIVFSFSNVHWQLVYLVCDGFLYCFCLIAELCETKKHYRYNKKQVIQFLQKPKPTAQKIYSNTL